MEEDKKKKKNKKRKNKQNKTTANSAPADSPGAYSVSPPAQNIPVTESTKISSALVDDPDAQEDDTASGMTLNPHGVCLIYITLVLHLLLVEVTFFVLYFHNNQVLFAC